MSDVSDFLTSGIKANKKTHALDTFVSRIVKNIVDTEIIPWLAECLTKYSVLDFHERMLDPNFDFITDWEVHHGTRFKLFIRSWRKFRDKIEFNTAEIVYRIVGVLQQNGWEVYDFEIKRLFQLIERLRHMIYD